MKHIYKKISLNQFRSRLPSTIKAYYDTNESYTFDGKTDFDENGKKPYVNYGLIPFSVQWNSGKYNGMKISFFTLSKWYHFVEFYIDLLEQKNCAITSFSNAYDYYHNAKDVKYSLDECIEFDEQIENICDLNGTHLNSAKIKLNEMIHLYFPKFYIDEQFQSNWNVKFLSIKEVNYWIEWFSKQNELYKTLEDCTKTKDSKHCCECEKFFKLGGEEMLNQLIEFINQLNIINDFEEPFFYINVKITNKIDDLGELSVLSEKWEEGIDYSSNLVVGNEQINSGTVISYNDNDWVLDHGKGYIYSNKFKEFYFGTLSGMTEQEKINYQDENQDELLTDNNQLIRLIEKNAISDPFRFNGYVNDNEHYVYSYDNKKYSYIGDLNKNHHILLKMFKNYQIYKNIIKDINYGFFYIKGNLYPINENDIINYNNSVYLVSYDNYGNPFTNINGIIYYAIFDETSGYVFNIKNKIIKIENRKNVYIRQKYYIVNDSWSIIIDNIIYNRILYYSSINGNYIIFNTNLEIITPRINNNTQIYIKDELTFGNKININEIKQETLGYFIEQDSIYLITPFKEYNSNLITGYTESKLSTFLSAIDVAYDSLGNKIPGSIETSLVQEGTLLGLLYKSKTMVHPSKYQEDNVDVYWCDFLDTIEIFYVNESNEVITNIYYLSNINNGFQGNLNYILPKLNQELIINGIKIYGLLKAKITYYMGCNLTIDNVNDNLQYNIINEGIKYVEIVDLIEKEFQYFINDYTFYIIKYYDMIFEKINYTNFSYNYNSTVNKAYFTFPITKFIDNNKFNDNGWVDFPVFREEYKLGSSSLQNIESDIYINRGTTKSFDKHLKLLEVNSLESLEQYGNGFFKIINN